jgi:hypothetical protein
MSKQSQEMKEIVDELTRIVGSGNLETGRINPLDFAGKAFAGIKKKTAPRRPAIRQRKAPSRRVEMPKTAGAKKELLLKDGDDF